MTDTTDGDLVVDPSLLRDNPPLEEALGNAGFRPKDATSVGIWVTSRTTVANTPADVAIDLLVPASVSPGSGRRAAELPGHTAKAARTVSGLEGALVDLDVMSLTSLDEGDPRRFDVRVAGPAALLVAKVHTIKDRASSSRRADKDALDVLRLLMGTTTDVLAQRYETLLEDTRSRLAASNALALIEEQFGRTSSLGAVMAARSAGPLADPDEIAGSCQLLANDLLTALAN